MANQKLNKIKKPKYQTKTTKKKTKNKKIGNGPMIDFGITRRPKDFIIGVGVGVVGFIVSWVLGILSQNLMGFMPEGVIGVLVCKCFVLF